MNHPPSVDAGGTEPSSTSTNTDAVDLLDELSARCRFPESGRLVCAVSGGADSLALLVLAGHTGRPVEAVHVDHGIRRGSDVEFQAVAAVAERVGASSRRITLDVVDGPNLEARAREARLAALPDDALLGHTADDRAEWVLLALARGAGLDGVASMAAQRRPLLGLRAAETRDLCRLLGIEPIADPHNEDTRFRRVRVRRELLPLMADIAERDVVPLLDRFASVAGEDAALLDQLASQLDPTDCRALAAAPPPLARRAVRRWLNDGVPIDAASTERVMDVVGGRRRATEITGGRRVSRHAQRLVVSPPAATVEP